MFKKINRHTSQDKRDNHNAKNHVRESSNSWVEPDGKVNFHEDGVCKTTFYFVDTLIVSDIHLGSPVSRAHQLLGILKKYSFKRLILNGDVFDDLNFNKFTETDWEALSYLRTISEPQFKKEIVWIAGNHDGMATLLSRLLGIKVYDEYVWEFNRKLYLATHGHQFDTFLNENVVISNIASWFYLTLQKLDVKNQRISRWVKRSSKSWLHLSEKIANDAMEYCDKIGAHVIFCGHTHLALQRSDNGIEYFNSGCWTDLPSHFITLDDIHGVKINEIY